MDFINRNAQQPNRAPGANSNAGVPTAAAVSQKIEKKHEHGHGGDYPTASKWFRISTTILLFSVTILVIALAGIIAFSSNDNESKFVSKSEYQAVFVNVSGTTGGQVYFGHITDLSSQYVRLTNVFYIQNQNSSSSSSKSGDGSYTLVKLGCELHGPEDQMVINRDQVYFWENIKSSGQVAQKISQYYKNNPNGQTCSSANSQSTQQPASNTTK